MSQSDSKLFRSQSRTKTKASKTTGGAYEPTVDDQLSRLEEDIRRLKIEFDVPPQPGRYSLVVELADPATKRKVRHPVELKVGS